jgi:tetratricopeptide (TPR) repeat protein
VELFVERARATGSQLALDPDTSNAVSEICRRLDGLPLALELAAARVITLPPVELLARLDRRLPVLGAAYRDLPARHATMRDAIAWSYELLEDSARHMFRRMAVFSGGCTLRAAETVCGSEQGGRFLDGLTSLVNSSLVLRTEGPSGEARFRMLETIREYAAEQLATSNEQSDVLGRHAEFFRDLAEEAEPHLTGAGQERWLARLESERANIRAALDRAESAGDVDTALRIASAVWRFWQQRGPLTEVRIRLERLVAQPEAQQRSPLRARALSALGGIAYWQNDYERLQEVYEEEMAIASELGDPQLLSRALFDLSFVPLLNGDLDGNEELLQNSLALAEGDDPFLTSQIWSGLGYLAILRDNPSGAIERLRRALSIYRELGEHAFLCETLVGLAGAHLVAGDVEAARRSLREATGIAAQLDTAMAVSMLLHIRSLIASHEGDYRRTARLLGAWTRHSQDREAGFVPAFVFNVFGDPRDETRAALGEEEFEVAWNEGFALTLDEIAGEALDIDRPPG